MLTYKIDIEALRQVLGDQTRVDLALFKPRTGAGAGSGTGNGAAGEDMENPLNML